MVHKTELSWKPIASPASVVSVEIVDESAKSCRASVPDHQLSLAIGNKGQNARLAAKLTGWKIDVKSEEEEDFISEPLTMNDFKEGLKIPSKLLPRRIKGGVVLVDTTYEIR